ncbi:unannotated protein [freshwater metagenome]|uniref:Unannotated protein n=1 Tax=freshwater metagenome TaxID=449393 RepID=A0A6J7FZS7_9ZZZZ
MSLGHIENRHLGSLDAAISSAPRNLLPFADSSVQHATHGQAAHELTRIQVGDPRLQRVIGLIGGRRQVSYEQLKQRSQILFKIIRVLGASHARSACPTIAVDDWEVDLVNVCIEIHKQILDLRDHLIDSSIGTVDLVHCQNDGQVQCERLAKHKARLGKRPLGGINEQYHSIDHGERTLNLAAKVSVARRVNNVDLDFLTSFTRPSNGGVFRKDRDALFTF